jgi:plastocyanin
MMRVLVAVGVVGAGSLAGAGMVAAASHDISVTNDAAKCDKTWGPPCFTPANGTVTQVAVGDKVTWHVLDGTHTVSPVDPSAFTGSGDLSGPDGIFDVTFDRPGVFTFYCKHHGSVDKDGKTYHGMWGKIDVRGDATTTTAPPPPSDPPNGSPPGKPDPGPPPPPPPPGPPRPTPPPPASSGSAPPPTSSGGSGGSGGATANGQTAAGTGRAYVGPPPSPSSSSSPPSAREAAGAAPRPSPTSGPGKGKDGGGSDPTTVPGATAVPPDEAVLPPSPPFATPTTTPVADAPTGAPQGDTVAVLKSEAGGRHRKLILLVTMFGVGAFVAGVGGWKFTHRASKYWPA